MVVDDGVLVRLMDSFGVVSGFRSGCCMVTDFDETIVG